MTLIPDPNVGFDENTLFKTLEVLCEVTPEYRITPEHAQDIIRRLLNAGLLIRERMPEPEVIQNPSWKHKPGYRVRDAELPKPISVTLQCPHCPAEYQENTFVEANNTLNDHIRRVHSEAR